MSRYIDADRIDWRLIIPTNVTIAEENMIHLAKKLVERQPTDDVVEVVHGEWVDNGKECWDGSIYYFRQCDICGFERDDCNADYDTPYCPNCGAKMDERRKDGE